ncbi:hypothetical protein P5V15_014433 [Pogonomyrmex californicus]
MEVDITKAIQMFLLKKEQEYGQLKFISSQATEETSRFIEELLETIKEMFKEHRLYDIKLFAEEYRECSVSSEIIQCYKYFLLNTDFSSQQFVIEDTSVGHLVYYWPALSPYLFIQIIWRLKWEELLIESLLYIPLDLCIEILDIAIRCISDLEVQQARHIIFLLLFKLYYKCLYLHVGTLSRNNMEELAFQLVAHFQVLLDLLTSKFHPFKSCVRHEKYMQHGIFIKQIFRHIKRCMHNKTKNYLTNHRLEMQFKITYGNSHSIDYFQYLSVDKVQSIVARLDQELITLLLNEIKQIDCFEFMDWAEVDDEENLMISLQRAIIIEGHYFMEFMKQDDFLATNKDLSQCLQQLVGSTNFEESTLTLQEICHNIANGKLDDIWKLMKRYKEWDDSVLNFLHEKIKLLEKKHLVVLLEYLHHRFAHCNDKNKQLYLLILTILIQQPKIEDMYYAIMYYVVRHFEDNPLMSLFSHNLFMDFIKSDIDMRDYKKLRIILIFVMLNPQTVLTTLVTVALGSTKPEFQNVMFKRPHVYFLHAIFCQKLKNQHNILTYILKNFCLHDNDTWGYKQFEAFMDDILYFETVSPDNLLNNVYIPYLANSNNFFATNLISVLTHIHSILKKGICTQKTDYALLIINLTKKMSYVRVCHPLKLKSIVNNVLAHGMVILNDLLAMPNLLSPDKKHEILNMIRIVEPIDRVRLAPLSLMFNYGNVVDVIQNYEKRCFSMYKELRMNSQYSDKIRDYVHSFQIDQDALIRHMLLHATEEEYKNFAIEMTTAFWSYFGWDNELVAYDNVLTITAEAMQLALKFTEVFSKDTFVSLLRAMVHYCNMLTRIESMYINEPFIRLNLLKILYSLNDIIIETQHDKVVYNYLLTYMYNIVYTDSENYFCKFNELIEMYLVRHDESTPLEFENSILHKMIPESENWPCFTYNQDQRNNMLKAYKFVCMCINETIFEDHI